MIDFANNLQIFYLDNLDFGREKNLLHDHTPRCKAYDYDTIKKLAKADRTRYRDGGLRSFGRKSVCCVFEIIFGP